MRNPLRNRKILVIIALAGIGLMLKGTIVILFPTNEVTPIDIEKYGISQFPEQQTIPRNYTESDFVPSKGSTPSVIKQLSITFTTMDLFAVNNPVHIAVNLKVKDPEIVNGIEKIIFMPTSPKNDYSDLGRANLDEFEIKNHDRLVELINNGTDTFHQEFDVKFYYQQDVGFILLVAGKGNYFERHVNPNTIFSVSPYTELIQTEVNRLTIAQIKQSNNVIKTQNQSNAVIEGLEWILLGWLPFEFGINRYR